MRKSSLFMLTALLLLSFTGLYAQELFIDSTGKVGIGNSTPQFKLHVTSTENRSSQFGLVNTVGNSSLAMLCYDQGNISIVMGAEYVNNQWKARSASVGWLYKLGDTLKLMRSGVTKAGDAIQPKNGISLNLINGNVGIDTSASADAKQKLLVAGNIKAAGSIEATGNIQAAGNIQANGKVYDGNGEVMPKGAIIMWSGNTADIPKGWALCNGQNGTPDLVDRFVLGAGSSSQRGSINPKSTGGNKEIRLKGDQVPQHNHKLRSVNAQGTNSAGDAHKHVHITEPNDNYLTTTNAQGYTDAASTVFIMPPYLALCYIMKL